MSGRSSYPDPGPDPGPADPGPAPPTGRPAPAPPAPAYPPPAGTPSAQADGRHRAGIPAWAVAVCALVAMGGGAAILRDGGTGGPGGTGGAERQAWLATRVTMPERLLGFPRRPEVEGRAEFRRVLEQVRSADGQGQLGVYSPDLGGGTAVAVVAARAPSPLSPAQQRADWDRLVASVRRRTGPTSLADRAPGPLGGRLACGAAADERVCIGVDAAGFVVAFGVGTVPGGLDALATVRGAVEQRPDGGSPSPSVAVRRGSGRVVGGGVVAAAEAVPVVRPAVPFGARGLGGRRDRAGDRRGLEPARRPRPAPSADQPDETAGRHEQPSGGRHGGPRRDSGRRGVLPADGARDLDDGRVRG